MAPVATTKPLVTINRASEIFISIKMMSATINTKNKIPETVLNRSEVRGCSGRWMLMEAINKRVQMAAPKVENNHVASSA